MLFDKTFTKPVALQSPDPDAGGGNGGKTEDPKKPDVRTFTQEELDALIGDRALRAKEATVKELLAKSGAESIEALLAAVEDHKKAKLAQQTEAEKTAAALKAAEDKASQAESARDAALQTASERLLKASVKVEAINQGFRPEAVDDVFLVINRSKITEKDGDFVGIKEAVEQVGKDKPFWKGKSDPQPRGTPKPPDPKKPGTVVEPPSRVIRL